MSNTTARQDILDRIAGEIADALRVQLPCDLFDIDALFRSDKPAAYAQLASYTDAQRVALATAFAALYTARFDLAGDDALTAAYVLALWAPHLEALAPAPFVAIERPGLMSRLISITADSTVAAASFEVFGQQMEGLNIDGQNVALCHWKHTVGRPELVAALAAALADVEVAIAALRTFEALAAAPEALADHTAISTETSKEPTMINVTIDPNATIICSEISVIRTLSTLDPTTLMALRILLEAQHNSPQFHRALNGDGRKAPGALRILVDGAPFTFEHHRLTIASQSDPNSTQSTDGAYCSCRGAGHAWCWHRAAWHLVVAVDALTDPHGLLRSAASIEPLPFEPNAA